MKLTIASEVVLVGVGVLAGNAQGQCQVQQILPPSPDYSCGGLFGRCIATSRARAAIGQPLFRFGFPNQSKGASYVLDRVAGTWQGVHGFGVGTGTLEHYYGFAADVEGNLVVVGMPYDNWGSGHHAVGGVFLWEKQNGTWHTPELLYPPIFIAGSLNGYDVALSKRLMVVGAPMMGSGGPGAAAVYFVGSWTTPEELRASDGSPGARFGVSVETDGSCVIVGSPGDHSDTGAAYVFEQANGNVDLGSDVWLESSKLLAPDVSAGDELGHSLAIDGDTAVVAAPGHATHAGRSGAVFIYGRTATGWEVSQRLVPHDPGSGDRFGTSLALEGDRLLVGAVGDDDFGPRSGSAYLFRRQSDLWVESGKLLSIRGSAFDEFGISVALADDQALVGAINDDTGCPPSAPNCDQGSVLVFALPESATQYCSCPLSGPCGNDDAHGGCLNSTGQGGVLQACGTGSVSTDDLRIEARWLPASQTAIAFMGPTATSLPLGDGQLCVGPGALGLFRFPAQDSGPSGVVQLGPGIVGLTHASNPLAGQIQPGDTWYFQCWYRDPGGPCGSGVNLTNGVKMEFEP